MKIEVSTDGEFEGRGVKQKERARGWGVVQEKDKSEGQKLPNGSWSGNPICPGYTILGVPKLK